MTLPPAGAAFRWNRESWGHALRCERLDPIAQHLFTTRQLQLRQEDDEAWRKVAMSVGGASECVLRVRQVHGRSVRVVSAIDVENGAAAVRPEADAVISDVADAVLAVQVADCVPMLMADDRLGVAGAVHAGWRGTCAGIAAAAVSALAREFGSRAGDLQVAVGPSIGACCYEVGGEVLDAFRSAGAGDRDLARWFTRTSTGSLRLDLWTANCDQLVAAGVPREHVHLSRLCTRTHAEVFDSYRAHGAGAGRMVAAIRVPPRADRTDSTATEDAHRAARP